MITSFPMARARLASIRTAWTKEKKKNAEKEEGLHLFERKEKIPFIIHFFPAHQTQVTTTNILPNRNVCQSYRLPVTPFIPLWTVCSFPIGFAVDDNQNESVIFHCLTFKRAQSAASSVKHRLQITFMFTVHSHRRKHVAVLSSRILFTVQCAKCTSIKTPPMRETLWCYQDTLSLLLPHWFNPLEWNAAMQSMRTLCSVVDAHTWHHIAKLWPEQNLFIVLIMGLQLLQVKHININRLVDVWSLRCYLSGCC